MYVQQEEGKGALKNEKKIEIDSSFLREFQPIVL